MGADRSDRRSPRWEAQALQVGPNGIGAVGATTIFIGPLQSGQTVTSFAFAIPLKDNDGKGRKAWITWGGDLHPAWQAKRCRDAGEANPSVVISCL